MIHGRDVGRAVIAVHYNLIEEYTPPSQDINLVTSATRTASKGPDLPTHLGGHRFPITDLHCYDWWDLFMQFGSYARARAIAGETKAEVLKGVKPEELLYEKWVLELMEEKGVRALPRDNNPALGRLVDGRAFWTVAGGEAVGGEGR